MRRLLAGCAGLLVALALMFGAGRPAPVGETSSAIGPTYGQAAAEARIQASCLRAAARSDDPVAAALRRCSSGAREAEMIKRRDRWFYSRRAAERGGDSPYLEAVAEARSMQQSSLAVDGPITWEELGPHPIGTSSLPWDWGGKVPYSGRVTSLATHPDDRRTAYIGTSNGGVWKTTDDGASWTPLFDAQPSLAIGTVAVDPNDPDVVFAGTGESNFGGPSYFGAGLFRSTDGGATWSKAGGSAFDECHFSGVEVQPGDGSTVIVSVHGTGSSVWEFWYDRCAAPGIWRSTDGGDTFERVLRKVAPSDLAVAPNNSSVWFAGFNYGDGVWKSTDSGATWKRVRGLPTKGTARVELDVVASTTAPTQVIYAAIATPDNGLKGVFRSDDSGDTWARLTQPGQHCAPQCDYNLTLAVDPGNPERAFFGGIHLNRYVSGTPKVIGWNKIHVDFHALGFDSARRLWIGGDGGVYRTSDGGATFSNLNSDLGTNLVYPGMSGSYAGPLYAGFQDNGTAAYEGSTAWRFVNWGDGFFTATDPVNPNPVYVTSQFLSLTKIVDGRRCKYLEAAGLPDAGWPRRAPFQAPLVMHPRDRRVLYAGTFRIFKTTNGDSTRCQRTRWSLVSQRFDSAVTAIAPAPGDSKTVYAATESGGLWVTRGSKRWRETGRDDLPARTVTDIAVHPDEPGTAWVSVTGFGGGHVFRTDDSGGSWTDVSGELPDAPANAVVVDARAEPHTLFVGTDVGVFWSDDDGATWRNTSVGLPNTVVMDLILDPVADRLIAGTFGRGVWSASLTGAD